MEYPGAYYHVMAGGNRRERIFRDDSALSRTRGQSEAARLLQGGLAAAGLEENEQGDLPGSDTRTAALASFLLERTVARQSWIAERLAMRSATNVSHQVRPHRAKNPKLPAQSNAYLNLSGYVDRPYQNRRMVMKSTLYAILLISAAARFTAMSQTQSPEQIAQEQAKAAAQHSATSNATWTTPLDTFNAYFSAEQANDWASTFALLTSHCISSIFGDSPPATANDFATLRARTDQNESAFSLLSFYYTQSPARPRISASYRCVAQISGQATTLTRSVTLTLVDTGQGWKIDQCDD